MQRKPYTRYSREFKLEAVRQAALGEKPKAKIARALGIRVGHLRDWRLQFEEEARTGVAQPPPAVGQDLEQLRREKRVCSASRVSRSETIAGRMRTSLNMHCIQDLSRGLDVGADCG
jgi:transposase-like protein